MARISMNELTTYRWSFEEDVANYAKVGLDAISVWRQKLSDFGNERGLELIGESGLQVASLLWAGGFTGSDGRSFKESIEDAHDAIRCAARMHAECLIVYSGTRAGHTHSHARRLLSNALADLLPHAREEGVTLALEPMHAECAREWTFLTSVDETVQLLRQVDDPCLKMAFDTYYFGTDRGIVERLKELVPFLAIVQLGDTRRPPDGEQDRCLLGSGLVPLGPIMGALLEAGYAGSFDVKLMGQEIETSDYQELLRHSRDTVTRLASAAV